MNTFFVILFIIAFTLIVNTIKVATKTLRLFREQVIAQSKINKALTEKIFKRKL